ncbi:methyltransferase [Candida orthopsilosis Co 90-125]|uniref:Methyltransferase n=1 Tax=Candida orthopsilosis (strain 90-125) TaxID=1136231 RepID=H8X664_CANO9|nr:methyltransferase [Candida orthopsilosis Co 90-125]CCG23312.1 methyltransferase [Candida orthopsilosis Co 90-125]
MSNDQAYYGRGFKKSIADTHSWRTVDNSSKFITPVLKPDFKVLDVGSGPGSITIDLAKNYLTSGGSVIGVEPTQELIDTANNLKESTEPSLDNVNFQLGSIYELPFEDNTFDLVHSHQVVIHLQDPVKGLKELARVTKPGGYVAVKDADLDSIITSPEKYAILKEYYVQKAKNAISTDIKAGRTLREKAIKAGYEPENITTTQSYWLLADDHERKKQWAELAINRIKTGGEILFTKDVKKNEEMCNEAIEKWHEWIDDETSLFDISHFEIIYKKAVDSK